MGDAGGADQPPAGAGVPARGHPRDQGGVVGAAEGLSPPSDDRGAAGAALPHQRPGGAPLRGDLRRGARAGRGESAVLAGHQPHGRAPQTLRRDPQARGLGL